MIKDCTAKSNAGEGISIKSDLLYVPVFMDCKLINNSGFGFNLDTEASSERLHKWATKEDWDRLEESMLLESRPTVPDSDCVAGVVSAKSDGRSPSLEASMQLESPPAETESLHKWATEEDWARLQASMQLETRSGESVEKIKAALERLRGQPMSDEEIAEYLN